jgi:beta-carotene hydroxylase
MTAIEPPKLAELGDDLLVTTRRRRITVLILPFLGVGIFAATVWLGWWWITPVIVFGIFIAIVTVIHDVVHRSWA